MSTVPGLNVAPRSPFEERPLRPPTIGRIRPGIKVLKSAARNNPQAVKLYDELVASGESFEVVDQVIERQCKISNALVPKNVEYFTCRRSDFNNPDIADEILKLYGEDRGQGVKLYSFPVVFAFNDWLENAPHQLTTWGASGRRFFSAYEGGVRYCKTYPKVARDERARRAVRNFGMRIEVHRQDNVIPDGICNTTQCPEFQAGQCKLNASLLFAIPEIKGLGLIELVTTSMYGIGKAREAMEMFAHANGRLSGNRLWITKKEFEISRQKEGEYVRSMQWIPILNAEVDISKELVRAGGEPVPALRDASRDNVVDIVDVRATSSMADSTVEAEGAFHVASDTPASDSLKPDIRPESGEDEGTPGQPPAENPDDRAPSTTAQSSLLEETIDEKSERMSGLLKKLGIATPERQDIFRRYAFVKFGKGWTKRVEDIDTMNSRLTEALAKPQVFDDEMEQAVDTLRQSS